MKTLLVAVREEDREQVAVIAAHEFRVYIASSDDEAWAMLSAAGIDGVVCCVDYASSCPLDLLKLVRSHPSGASLPFVVVREPAGRQTPESYAAIEDDCSEHGIPYFDGAEFVRQRGEAGGHAHLRHVIKAVLEQY